MRTNIRAIAVLCLILGAISGCTRTITAKATFDVQSNQREVPYVIGLTAAAAESKLVSMGLIAEYTGETNLKVTNQSPIAGVQLKKGEVVTLILEVTTLTVTGTITLMSSDGYGIQLGAGASCEGVGGYDDIYSGTQVIVTGASGQTLALGALEDGLGTATSCTFAFSVSDVPNDEAFYSLIIGHRDCPQYSKFDLGTALALTLGS